MDMTSFAPKDFFGWSNWCPQIERYMHRSRIFMHYAIRTAFYRMQKQNCWLLLLHSKFLRGRFFWDHLSTLLCKRRGCALYNFFHSLTRLSWKLYRPILFLQLMIWTSRPHQFCGAKELERKDTSAVSVTKVSKAPNYSENTFFPLRRVLNYLSSAQLAVKASATSNPKRNIALNTELNESSNAVVER